MPRRGKEEGGELPPELQKLVDGRPIVLGSESIGVHFRNAEEIADVQAAISYMHQGARKRGEKIILFGLTGSRTRGAFSYSPKALFAKKLNPYGSQAARLYDQDRAMYYYDGRIPQELLERLQAFADYLHQQQVTHPNLSSIDFSLAPETIRAFTQFDPFASLPFLLVPREQSVRRNSTVTPYPAFFFPDIDVVGISSASGGERGLGDWIQIGSQSGVAIQHVIIAPMGNYSEGLREIKEGMFANFRPFAQV